MKSCSCVHRFAALMEEPCLDPGPDFVLRGHNESVNALCFLSSNILSSGSGDGEIKLWNMGSRRTLATLVGSKTSSIQSLSFIREKNIMLSCSRDGYVNVWDASRCQSETSIESTLSFYCGAVHFCNACSDRSQEDSNTIITPSREESQIIIWDLRVGSGQGNGEEKGGVKSKAVGCIDTNDSYGMLTALHYNSKLSPAIDTSKVENCSGSLFAGFESGNITSYDLRTRRPVGQFCDHTEPVMALDTHVPSHGKFPINIVSGGAGKNLYLHQQSDSKTKTRSALMRKPGVGCTKIRNDGRILVSGHWDNSVRIFSTKKLKPLAIMRHHIESVYSADFMMEQPIFATGSKDRTIAIWSLFAQNKDT